MRTAVILSLVLSTSLAGLAETIVLKNGRKIVVDSVREENGRVLYEIGDQSYAIPKSSIDHIDSFGSVASQSAAAAPDFVPQMSEPQFADTVSVDVIKNDRVDDTTIATAEASGDPRIAATANFLAGRFSLEQGNRDAAARYFDRALRFQPDDGVILVRYASVLLRMSRPQDALPLAEHAVRVAAASSDSWAILGYALLQSDRAAEAVPAFEKAYALHHDPLVQQYLALARREASAGANFSAAESSHFSLRFEGHAIQSSLPRSILENLDADYDSLVAQLGYAPHGSIPVVLYTDQTYFNVTKAPRWSSALNNGKLQFPVHGLLEVNPELAHVLRHELTHTFVNQISRGRCPMWLNEGVAQLMEPESLGGAGHILARLFNTQRQVPLNSLEGSFIQLDANSAGLAYAESLAAVEYINDTYGMSDLRRLLERIGEGASTEAALRATFNTGYGQFEQDIGTYLKSKYGD